ncbi:MAG TPA: cobalamin-independent methionine synthase II family protein [Candidatus Acidoferrales bacterium]|nr:cobalamin-independent methionine synthase II family protein [Candidatus Acidoferrales bacterium]
MPLPYRADHIGSFLRPPELVEARQNSPSDAEGRRTLEDRSILRALAKQKELGLEIFTDGEFRRSNFMGDFTEAIEGFDFADGLARNWKTAAVGAPALGNGRVAGVVVKKLRTVRPLTGHELPFLKEHSPGPIKMTLPSATQFPAISYKRGRSEHAYPTYSAFLWDIVEIMKKEVARLAAEGVQYIQIDAPRYSYFMDPKWREWIRTEMQVEPDAWLEESVRADNACFEAARRPGVTLAIHLCRGNSRSHWYAEGGYDAIAEKLFGTLAVDRFLLEYDDSRSGTFEPLRFVPRNKIVVLGLISSKLPQLENSDEVVRRIDEAAKYVPIENLTLSPQCGFASTFEGNLLTEEEQWAKLRLVVETARRVWG